MSASPRTSAADATHVTEAGHFPLPVPVGSKGCVIPDWPQLRITTETVPEYFPNGHNVGVLTGAPSNLVCVDEDCDEALRVAPFIMPKTLMGGREQRPCSKAFYLCVGDPPPTTRYKTPDGETVVELLSTGAQAVVTGIHPTGDRYRWEGDGFDPGKIVSLERKEIEELVLDEAVAAAILRHYPAEGGRNDYVLRLAGYLLRKLSLERVERVVEAAGSATGDEELDKRLDAVRATAKKLEKPNNRVTGAPALKKAYPELFEILAQEGWLGDDSPQKNQTETLIDYAKERAELFHTTEDKAYATIEVSDHSETWPVRSRRFHLWLTQCFFEEHDKAPDPHAISNAKNTIEAVAQFSGVEREVFLRVAQGEDRALYLDMGNARWEAIKITPEGYEVVSNPPVEFIRSSNMAALPYPDKGARGVDLEKLLRPFVNVGGDDNLKLLIGWQINALHPHGSYTILVLQGEQGSAKTSTERFARSITDPSVDPLRAPPKDERDLAIAATGNRCLGFDNVSYIAPWLSDAMCRMATGGAFATRELYSDDGEVLFAAKRPQLLNGITNMASRGDLQERSILIECPHIEKGQRKREADVLRDFEDAHPRILGALLDVMCGVLKRESEVEIEELPRMTEFAVWGTAAEESLGWEPGDFMRAYTANLRAATQRALSTDPVAVAVAKLMQNRDVWEGTPTELYNALKSLVDYDVQRSKLWPQAPKSLTERLDRIAPALREFGYEVNSVRSGQDGRKKRITKIDLPLDPEDLGPTPGDGDAPGDEGDAPKTVRHPVRHQENPANEHKNSRDDEGDEPHTSLCVSTTHTGEERVCVADAHRVEKPASPASPSSPEDKTPANERIDMVTNAVTHQSHKEACVTASTAEFTPETVRAELEKPDTAPAQALAAYRENPEKPWLLKPLVKAVLDARGMSSSEWGLQADTVLAAIRTMEPPTEEAPPPRNFWEDDDLDDFLRPLEGGT